MEMGGEILVRPPAQSRVTFGNGIIEQSCSGSERKGYELENPETDQLSSRLRKRLPESAMLDLTQRLIAIPSENPPGDHYEETARTLFDELDRLGFDEPRRDSAQAPALSLQPCRTLPTASASRLA